MTNTDTFYARYLNTATCEIGYNLLIAHHIIEVHAIWLHSKPMVIGQFIFFFFTLEEEPYYQTMVGSLVAWFYWGFIGLICFVLVVWLFFFSFFEIMIHEEIRENMKAGVEPLMLPLQQGITWLLQVGMPLSKSHG